MKFLIHLLGGLTQEEFNTSRDNLVNFHAQERKFLYEIIQKKLDVLIEDKFTDPTPEVPIEKKPTSKPIQMASTSWSRIKQRLELKDRIKANAHKQTLTSDPLVSLGDI